MDYPGTAAQRDRGHSESSLCFLVPLSHVILKASQPHALQHVGAFLCVMV
jgi:hypothetical protein